MKIGRGLVLAIINGVCLLTLVIWVSKNISMREVISAWNAMPKMGVTGVLFLNAAVLLIYGLRMSALVGVRFVPAFATILLGFGLNGMLPLRLGDLAKLVYARQLFGISTARLTAASAVEKVMDLGAVLILGFTITQFISFRAIDSSMHVLAILLLVAIAGLLTARAIHRRWQPTERRAYIWVTTAIHTIHEQLKGRQALVVASYTVGIWATTVVMTYMMFASIYPEFGWADAFLLTLVLVLAIAIPGAPAGLGIVEAGIAGYLHAALNVDAPHAIAAAIAFHLATVIPQILGATGILIWAMLGNKRLRMQNGVELERRD
jgi:uncharacterized protein (TIRG00374 family)